MVAVIAGVGLGTERSSASSLGAAGQQGGASVGQAGDKVYVNAANGNLVVQVTDQILLGVGSADLIARTYNSLGTFSGNNGALWSDVAGRHLVISSLTGTLNTAGSTIQRVAADGSVVTYSYNAGYSYTTPGGTVVTGAYVANEGGEAYDTLTNSAGTWTWTDGASGATDIYNANGQLTSSADKTGQNTLTYGYSAGGLLTSITSSDGESLTLSYNSNNQLTGVTTNPTTGSNFTSFTQDSYAYDSAGRLTTVTLTGGGNTYTTTYAYVGSSNQLASISQSDGSFESFGYNSSGQVSSVAQTLSAGVTTTTSLSYDTLNRLTTITDGSGNQTVMGYDAIGELTQLIAPAATPGSGLQTLNFVYDSLGNVTFAGQLGDPNFTNIAANWASLYTSNASITTVQSTETDAGVNVYRRQTTTTPASGFGMNLSQSGNVATKVAVTPGQQVAVSAYLATTNASGAQLYVYWYSASGAYLGTSLVTNVALGGSFSSGLSGAIYAAGYTTVIAGAASAVMGAFVVANGSGPLNAAIAEPVLQPVTNAIWDPQFKNVATNWNSLWVSNSSISATLSSYVQGGVNVYQRQTTTTPAAGFGMNLGESSNNMSTLLPVTAGQSVEASAYTASTNASGVSVFVDWFSATGAYLGNSGVGSYVTGGSFSGGLATAIRAGGFATAPSGAAFASLAVYAVANGSGALSVAFSAPMLRLASSGQTALVPYTPDQNGAYFTGLNTEVPSETYTYDSHGNRLSKVDSAGDTEVWTYNGLNQMLTDTLYNVAANGYTAPSGVQTTTYIYGANNNLIYTVSPLGEVVEDLYQGAGGEVTQTVRFAGAYTGALTLTALNTWIATAANQVGAMVTGYSYQLDGQLSSTTHYATSANAQGATSAGVTSYSFDSAGDLLSKGVNGFNPQQTNSYDTLGRLTQSVSQAGVTTNYAYSYNTTGAVTTATTPSTGVVTTSQYNLAGELISTTVTASGLPTLTTSYAYDSLGRLALETDPNGASTYHLYDNTGRKGADVLPDGALSEYVYNANNQVIETIQYATRLTSAQLTTLASATAPVSLASVRPSATGNDRYAWTIYDAAGRVAETIDGAGAVTTYAYDGASNLIATTRYATVLAASALASFTTIPPTSLVLPTASATDATTRSFYDADGRKVGTLDADGDLARFVYDAAGDLIQTTRFATVTTASLRAAGTFAQLLANVGTSPQDQTTNSVYDGAGRLRYAIDPTGRVIEYAYDAAGHLLHEIDYAGSIASTTNYTMDYVQGQISANGLAALAATHTTYDLYDNAGRKVADVLPDGALTEYVYNANNQVIETIQYATRLTSAQLTTLASATAPAGLASVRPAATGNDRYAWTIYDAVGRVTKTIDANGAVTAYVYDADSNLIGATQYATVLSASVVAGFKTAPPTSLNAPTASATDATTRSFYDADGRKVGTLDADGDLTRLVYDAAGDLIQATRFGNVATASLRAAGTFAQLLADVKTSPQDQTTNSVYDGAGRLRYAIDPTGRVTEYAYDAAGHLLHEIDYAGSIASTTSYTMDYVQGQISANALAATRTTRSVYGADGRLYYAIDAMGDVTGYSYDAFGHLVKTARYAAPYAASGDQTLATLNSWASVNASAANDRVTRTVFDTLGRAIYAIDGEGYVTQLQYDADSHVTKQIRYAEVYSVADGVTQSSLAALISANAVVANEAVHRYAYDGDGRVAFDIDATGAVTAFSYDAFGEVVKRHSYNPAYTGSDTSLATLQAWVANTASADSAANRNDQVSRTVYDAAGRVVYTIDADGYLTGYQYDGVGRLLQQTRYASATASAGVYMFDNGDPAYDTIRLFYQATLNRLPDPDPTGGAGWVYSLRNGSTTHDAAVAFTTSAEFLADTNGMSHRQIVDYIYQAALHRPADTAGENQWTAYLDAGNSIADMVVQFLQMPEIQTTYVTPGMVAAMLAANPPASVEITSYSYDAQGRLTQTIVDNGTGHLNLTTSSTYDAFGNKVAVTDPRGDVGYFYYDLLNRLTLQIDPEGYATATTYSIGDQAVSVTRYATRISGATVGSPPSPAPGAQDETTSFTRDKLDRLTATTDAMGFTESYGLDAFGNRITLTSKPPGNDHANSGGVTTYTYDKRGLLLSETLPVTSTKSDGTSVAVTNTYTYDARGNRTKMVEAAGLPEQRTTSYAYDLDNRLVSQTGDAVSILDADLTTLHNNQIPTQTMVYDRRGNVIETDVTLDATHVARTLTYYDDLNRKIAQVDAMGALSTWTYDANNNAIKQFVYDTPITLPATPGGTPPSPANGSSARETDYGYDGNNRLTSTTTAYQNALTGYWNGSTYVLSMSGTPSTPSASATIKTQTTYDAAGNVTSQIDAAGNTTYFYYDRAGRKVAQVNAGGYLTTYTLDSDGNVLTEQRYATAVTGVTASTTLASLLASASNSVAAPPVTTATVAYNSSGNVITPNLGGGAISSIAISTAASHGTATASAGTYTPTLVYTPPANYSGADSFKYTITYANGSTFTGTVNVTVSTSTTATLAVTTSAAGAADRVTTFTYDKNGRRLTETRLNVTSGTVSATGVLSVAQANATITYTYNGLGEVTSKTEATGDQTQYIYDSLGRQTAVLAPTYADYNSATVQTQTQSYYDGLGDLIRSTVGASITVGLYGTTTATDRITTYAYGAGGRLASTTDASGFTKNFYYDRAGRVVAETYSRLKSDGTTVAEAMAFTYDALGRGVAQTTANQLANTAWTFGGGQTVTFGDSNQVRYDAFGQITGKGVNGLWQETYTYDMAGRQFSSTANDGTTKYYVYDANGNNTLEIDSTGTDLSTYTLIGAINLLTNNGANTVGAAAVAGVVVTIKAFDARNENIKTILPFRELNQNATTPTINDAATITTLSQFDAFGDVVQQTDARGGVTNYAYNTEGKLIRTDSPTVNSTDEHGVISAIRPTQFATYDLSGRLIATQDGNGNVNSRALLAGTGYGGADPRETAEFHPDGGVARYGYDVFGDQRTYTNELGNVEQRTYDAMDRVTAVTHPTRAAGTIANPGSALALTDDYAYDGLGQLIQRWNSQLGSSDKQTTDYDSQGRVTKTVDYMGQATLYAYAWSATLATTGLSTFGGWTKTTTNASGLQSTLGQDYFGRTVAHKDFGNQVYTFGFDKAGRLITETSVDSTSAAQQNLTYTYFNTGKIATVYDNTTVYAYFPRSIKSTYKYDVAGHMTGESYVGSFTYFNLSSGLYTYTTSYQNTTVTYDALGRMATYADTGQAAAHNVSIAYEYDANGNIRHMASTYLDLVSNANTTQDFWYKYDGMNRFTTTQGGLVNASGAATTVRAATDQIVRGYTGTNITYDAAGERIMAETTPIIYYRHHAHSGSSSSPEDGYHREDYTYTADGYLATVGIYDAAPIGVTQTAEEICAVNVRDAMGRVTSYTEYGTSGPTGSSTYSSAKTYNADSLVTTETDNTLQSDSSILTTVIANSYNAANLVTDSAVTISKNSVLQSANDTTTTYVWSDTAQQKLITYKTGSSPTNYTTTNTTTLAYDSNGHLTSATIADGRPRTVYYVTNALGEILSRTESSAASSNPVEYYYYLNGMQVGDIGNNGTSQTDYAFSVRWGAAPTGPFANGSAKSYAAFGDYYAPIDPTSLGSQAQAGSTYTVQSGDTLQSIASALWGDSNLWYMIADANGLTGGETLTAGTTLSIPSKVVNIHNNSSTFTVYDPTKAIGNIQPNQPAPPPAAKHGGCGIIGQILMIVVAIAVVAVLHVPITNMLAGIISGGAPAGSAALAAATAAATPFGYALAGAAASIVSQGVGLATGTIDKFSWTNVALAAIGSGVASGLGGVGGSGWVGGAIRGAAGNAITQGIAVATGLQSKFDWTGVAVGAVVGGVMQAVGHAIDGKFGTPEFDSSSIHGFSVSLAAGLAGGVAGAATRSALSRTDFGDNLIAALPDIIGQTIGSLIASQETAQSSPQASGNGASGNGASGNGSSSPEPEYSGPMPPINEPPASPSNDPIGDLLQGIEQTIQNVVAPPAAAEALPSSPHANISAAEANAPDATQVAEVVVTAQRQSPPSHWYDWIVNDAHAVEHFFGFGGPAPTAVRAAGAAQNNNSAISGLLNRISLGEGTSDAAALRHGFASGYDVTLGYGAYATSTTPLSQMTLSQVDDLQTQILNNPDNNTDSSALGKYQFTRTTLRALEDQLGLQDNQLFTPALQDQLGQQLLVQRGLNKYIAGTITAQQFQDNISREWDSVATSSTGMAYTGHSAATSTAQIQAAIAQIRRTSH